LTPQAGPIMKERGKTVKDKDCDPLCLDEKYNRVSDIDWECCAIVLDEEDKKRVLVQGW
jgi:hypothetical protein